MTADTLPVLFLAGTKSWEMPQLPSLNKLPARTTLIPYPTADDALTFIPEKSPWFMNLNGQWDFKIRPKPEDATAAEVSGDHWSSIQVPGNWTMQGFGR